MNITSGIRTCEGIKKEAATLRGTGLVTMSEKCIDENNIEREIVCEPPGLFDNGDNEYSGISCKYKNKISPIDILIIIFVIIIIRGPFIALIINMIRKKYFKERNNNSNDDDDDILPEYSSVNIHSTSNENNTTIHLPTYEEAIANSNGNNYQN